MSISLVRFDIYTISLNIAVHFIISMGAMCNTVEYHTVYRG